MYKISNLVGSIISNFLLEYVVFLLYLYVYIGCSFVAIAVVSPEENPSMSSQHERHQLVQDAYHGEEVNVRQLSRYTGPLQGNRQGNIIAL